MTVFDIPGGKGTEETKITNNNKPKGIDKITQEPLISTIQEVLNRAKLGSESEKAQAYVDIYKNLNMLELSDDKKNYIKNELILELIKLEAVPELAELKAVDALKFLGINASDKVALEVVKALVKLKDVDALIILMKCASDKVAKAAIEGLEAMFQEFVKEKNVYALKFLGINASDKVALEAVKALVKLKDIGALIILVKRASKKVAINVVKALGKLKAVDALRYLGLGNLICCPDEVVIEVVKELGKLKEVKVLRDMGKIYSEKVVIEIVKELTKLKDVEGLIILVIYVDTSDKVFKEAVKGLIELNSQEIYGLAIEINSLVTFLEYKEEIGSEEVANFVKEELRKLKKIKTLIEKIQKIINPEMYR